MRFDQAFAANDRNKVRFQKSAPKNTANQSSSCPTKALRTITPYEAWKGHKPSISHMRTFKCLAYAHVPSQKWTKLDDKAIKCIFLG